MMGTLSKGVTDGQTDRQTEIAILKAAWSQLKIKEKNKTKQNKNNRDHTHAGLHLSSKFGGSSLNGW